jgi:hypothetical protein
MSQNEQEKGIPFGEVILGCGCGEILIRTPWANTRRL